MTIIPKKKPRARAAAPSAIERERLRGAVEPASDVALRTRGLRLTDPRRVVLEVVRGTDAHPTAASVHRLVRRRLPRVSLGTVYRNLRLLVAEGLVNELPGPHARFDGNLSDHHHFTCLTCGRIVDVAGPMTEPHSRALCTRVAQRSGFSVTHHRIEFFGRCPACGKTRGRRGRRGRAPS
jgi:Fe2+ or Zn2+ uptake regulation protein